MFVSSGRAVPLNHVACLLFSQADVTVPKPGAQSRYGLPPIVQRETRTPVLQLSVTAPVGYLGGVYHAVSECQRLSEEFTADGGVALRIAVELGQVS